MPSANWRETIGADEEARFARYARELAELQKRRAKGGPAARALHAKSHVGAAAELEVHGPLPDYACHGLFARPGKYAAYVRFSNGSPMHQRDTKGDVRGLAIKVLGVDGKKVLGDASTQDFLAIQSSATPFRTPDEFVAFVRAAATPATLLFKLFAQLGFRRTIEIVKSLASGPVNKPVTTLAGMNFYSALPIRIGPHAARYALETLQARDALLPADRGGDYLADDLAKRLREGPLIWDLKLQFFENESRTPIEDASVDWDTPYVSVARMTVLRQDVSSEEGEKTSALVEKLSFDPWHALHDHTPLGAMMRARKHAYYASAQGRGASEEPD